MCVPFGSWSIQLQTVMQCWDWYMANGAISKRSSMTTSQIRKRTATSRCIQLWSAPVVNRSRCRSVPKRCTNLPNTVSRHTGVTRKAVLLTASWKPASSRYASCSIRVKPKMKSCWTVSVARCSRTACSCLPRRGVSLIYPLVPRRLILPMPYTPKSAIAAAVPK